MKIVRNLEAGIPDRFDCDDNNLLVRSSAGNIDVVINSLNGKTRTYSLKKNEGVRLSNGEKFNFVTVTSAIDQTVEFDVSSDDRYSEGGDVSIASCSGIVPQLPITLVAGATQSIPANSSARKRNLRVGADIGAGFVFINDDATKGIPYFANEIIEVENTAAIPLYSDTNCTIYWQEEV